MSWGLDKSCLKWKISPKFMGGAGPHQPKGKNQRSLEKPMSWQLWLSSKLLWAQATQWVDTTIEAASEHARIHVLLWWNKDGQAHHYKWEMTFKAATDTTYKPFKTGISMPLIFIYNIVCMGSGTCINKHFFLMLKIVLGLVIFGTPSLYSCNSSTENLVLWPPPSTQCHDS